MPAEISTAKQDQYAQMRALADQYCARKKRVPVRRPAGRDRYAQMMALAERHCASEKIAQLPPLVSGNPLDVAQASRLTGRRTVIALIAGAVLSVAAVMLYVSVRESASWAAEARARQREAALIESEALTARIEGLNEQAEALERKANILANYGEDLRFSRSSQDGYALLDQSEAILADRKRLRHEAGKLAWKQKMLQEDLFDVQSR